MSKKLSEKLSKKFELKAADLRCICDHRIFKFKNTSQINPLDEVIGQPRQAQTKIVRRGHFPGDGEYLRGLDLEICGAEF